MNGANLGKYTPRENKDAGVNGEDYGLIYHKIQKTQGSFTDAISSRNTQRITVLLEQVRKEYQGGLSDDVFNSLNMSDYILKRKGNLYGYFALTKFRDNPLDEYLESELIKRGLNIEQIVCFLGSKIARVTLDEWNHDPSNCDSSYEGNSYTGSYEERKGILDNYLDGFVTITKEMMEQER